MLLNPINNNYVFLADDDQLSTLFMMTMMPPFVVGRVIYITSPTDLLVIQHRKLHYCTVLKYNIAVVFEKTLLKSDNPDDWVYCINNMAHLFYQWRIAKNPGKYSKWKLGSL